MKDQYLSVSQVATLKGVSRSAVYKAIEQKRLPCLEIVGTKAIKRADAEAWSIRTRTDVEPRQPPSPETKAKISASQRLRWQKRKEK